MVSKDYGNSPFVLTRLALLVGISLSNDNPLKTEQFLASVGLSKALHHNEGAGICILFSYSYAIMEKTEFNFEKKYVTKSTTEQFFH